MTKIAIMIDGGFFLKRLQKVVPRVDVLSAQEIDRTIGRLVAGHLRRENKITRACHDRSLLYRCFFYDATPYQGKTQLPISGTPLDFGKTNQAKIRSELFALLRRRSHFAVRLGEVKRETGWRLTERAQKEILRRQRGLEDLVDSDFVFGHRQKGVDMRMGVDIASVTLKKQASTIILVTGDADFVPAAKLARREGARVVLDPMWLKVSDELFEHIDGLGSGLPKPTGSETPLGDV